MNQILILFYQILKLDTETVPVDLRTLSNVVNNDRVKKTVYDELVKKVKIMQGRQKHKKAFK